MPHPTVDLKELTLEELEQCVEAWGQPRYRARQLTKWLYKGAQDFAEMTDVSRAFRQELAERAHLSSLILDKQELSRDGTRKFRWAGCAMGCRFCLTARQGFVRNLTASEIVNQILGVKALLSPDKPLTNLVFMGMGEPLANFEPLVRALRIIQASWGLNFSARRVTVSTVGLAPLIPRLGQEIRVNLTVSLNAADDVTRNRIMPINRTYPLETVLTACRAFPLPRHRRITFAYVLIAGVNDSPEQARKLAKLLRGFRAKINLIPFNPHLELPYAAPPRERVSEFQEILREAHYPVFIRESRGQDIAAACGQLVGELK
jgi:23S rRNA (adenine2503-C2)-methyltransferase